LPGVGVGTTVLIERMHSRKSSLLDLDCKIGGARQDANAMTPGQRQRALATIASERLAVDREPVFYVWLFLDLEERRSCSRKAPAKSCARDAWAHGLLVEERACSAREAKKLRPCAVKSHLHDAGSVMPGDAENGCIGRGRFGRVKYKECLAIKVDVKALAAIDRGEISGTRNHRMLPCRCLAPSELRLRRYRRPRTATTSVSRLIGRGQGVPSRVIGMVRPPSLVTGLGACAGTTNLAAGSVSCSLQS
jgi:hypothetical protein